MFIGAIGNAQPIEDSVSILAIQGTPHDYHDQIIEQMNAIAQYWPNPDGVTVTLLNNGYPIDVEENFLGGVTADDKIDIARNLIENEELRGAADVVIVFTSFFPSCGYAPMHNWNSVGRHEFVENAEGLDLDGKDEYYIAMVNLTSNCQFHHPSTALHEFGHLFSAGHSWPNAPYGSYLLPENHAWWWWVDPIPGMGMPGGGEKTIMAEGTAKGTQLFIFSDGNHPSFPWQDNKTGLAYTARSVANYVRGVTPPPGGAGSGDPLFAQCGDGFDNDGNGLADYPEDPSCLSANQPQENPVVINPPQTCPNPPQLNGPIAVNGSPTGCGVGAWDGWTKHLVWWIDECPNPLITEYQVWAEQPPGHPPIYVHSTVWNVMPIMVSGPDARIRVKACHGGVCTPLSADSYIAQDFCFM